MRYQEALLAPSNTPRRGGETMRITAVDVGLAAVRAVQVEISGGQARLLKRGMAPLPTGCWNDLASAQEPLAQAIRTALANGGISATEAVVALPRRLVTMKHVRLPHATPEQVRGMVRFEAQQYIPFPLEEVVLDYQILSDETEEMTTVLIAAARRSLVEDLLAAFDRAGIEVIRLSISALALAAHAQNGGMPVALLDVERGEMDIAIVSAGRLLFTRATAVGDSADGVEEGRVLAAEVARSLSAYQNEYRAQPVTQLLVAAPLEQLSYVEEALGSFLDVPVARINGALMPPADPEAVAYATALGLALGARRPEMGGIDLIPPSRKERKAAQRRRIHSLIAATGLIVIALVGALWMAREMTAQRKEHIQAVAMNRALTKTQNTLKKVKEEHDQLVQIYEVLSRGLERNLPAVEVLKAISDAVPRTGIYLSQLSIERGGSISLRGNANNETAATDLVLALQKAGVFAEVRLGYLGDAQTETNTPRSTPPAGAVLMSSPTSQTSFLITCRLKTTEQRVPPKEDVKEEVLAKVPEGANRP